MRSVIEISKIKNLTTETDLIPAKKGLFFEVSSFTAGSLTCTLPELKAAVGHLVSLEGHLLFDNEKLVFDAIGKVLLLEETEDGFRLEVGLRRFNKDLWSRFLSLKQAEQNRVDLLFARIKGEA